jgi:hypothetical protein
MTKCTKRCVRVSERERDFALLDVLLQLTTRSIPCSCNTKNGMNDVMHEHTNKCATKHKYWCEYWTQR